MSAVDRSSGRRSRVPATAALVLFTLVLTLLAPGCALNPATGKQEFSLVSESQEIQLGTEGDKAVQAEYGVYDNAELSAYVDRVGQKLAAISERPDLPWHFRVVDSPVVNAFALPGGYIYITRGILALLNSEAQLAGVLGHEIGHVTARHAARQMTRQELASLGLGVGSVFIKDFRPYSDLAQQGLGLLFLKYGRGDETQADELGVRYATRAGYDPREIPATYASLKQLDEQSGQSLPGFLSTHPDPGTREVTTQQLADAAVVGKAAGSLRIAGVEYKRELADLVYGDDPREGFVEAGAFYHPGLGFQLRFPAGWKIQNSQQAVTGVSADQNAAVEMTLAQAGGTVSPAEYVRALQQKGAISSSQGGNGQVNAWNAWIGQIVIPKEGTTGTPLHAAWVARDAGRYFQFLGAPGDATGQPDFHSTLMSFKNLTDPALLGRLPNRVALVTVAQPSATVATVANGAGRLAIPMEEVAFLNHTTTDAIVHSGFLLKIVQLPANR
jgi:predicted Zn-dependent protease